MEPGRDLLSSNLNVLAASHPRLAERLSSARTSRRIQTTAARSGALTAIVDGLSLHSRVDPEAEAAALTRSAEVEDARRTGRTPLVFGLGLGYHVLALAKLFVRVGVVEPELGMIRTALSHLDFRQALPRLDFLDAPPESLDWSEWSLIPHAPSARLHREVFARWREAASGRAGRFAGPGPAETIQDLAGKHGASVPGIEDLLSGWEGGKAATLDDLARAAAARRGPVAPAEVYALLLRELS